MGHVIVPSFDHLPNFPDTITVCRWGAVCEYKLPCDGIERFFLMQLVKLKRYELVFALDSLVDQKSFLVHPEQVDIKSQSPRY